jgi:hypothetical protein
MNPFKYKQMKFYEIKVIILKTGLPKSGKEQITVSGLGRHV